MSESLSTREMKRVIVFASELLPRSETFIKEQVRALKEWKAVLAGYRRVSDGLDLSGIDTFILPGLDAGKLGHLRLRFDQWRGTPHRPTVRALRQLDADLVHVHFGTNAVDIWPSVREAGLPMLVTLHGYDINVHREWWESGRGGIRRRNYPRRLLELAAEPRVHFIAVSQAIKRRAIAVGMPEQKITVAYIGVDTERFRPGKVPITERPRRILFVGRMVENKAPLLLIRAYAEVRKAVPDAELTMIGDGPLFGAAKTLAKELGEGVTLLGACDSNGVISEMHNARMLCLPSVETRRGDGEGFGLVLLEAQACGLPVVTSALGGTQEGMLAGKTGYAINAGDIDSLVNYLHLLVVTPDLASRMSVSARDFATRSFDIFQLTGALEYLYSECAEQANHR